MLGIPAARACPPVDPLGSTVPPIRHILAPPRAGLRPLRRRLRPRDRQAGRLHRHQRPRRDQHRHAAGDAQMDSIPIVVFSGQVPTKVIGNDAFQEADVTGITRAVHEVELPGQEHPRAAAGDQRGVPDRHQRPAGPGADRPAEGHLGRHLPEEVDDTPRAAHHQPPQASRHPRRPRQAGRGRGGADQPRGEAGPLRRRRRHRQQRLAGRPQAGRQGQHPLHHHPAGPGRVRRARPQDACTCSACTAPPTPTTPCRSATC